jgi:hypothetical protein
VRYQIRDKKTTSTRKTASVENITPAEAVGAEEIWINEDATKKSKGRTYYQNPNMMSNDLIVGYYYEASDLMIEEF